MNVAQTTVLVTGGAGFIGSAVCRLLASSPGYRVINLDSLTYAANLRSLGSIEHQPNYCFVGGDICDGNLVAEVLQQYEVDAVIHLAAESHVDRSIAGPAVFIESNIVGSFRLLEASLARWQGLAGPQKEKFRFIHVSTDEVFGDLPFDEGIFTERSPYRPSSPYSASKAASDHLARAWFETYRLPVIVTNCSNNFGPYQYPEKLIPMVIQNAVAGRSIPIYGEGRNVRDWLYVEDHASALKLVLECGSPGERYNIGGGAQRSNLDLTRTICSMLDQECPLQDGRSHADQITFVPDRPGHDRRYAIDATKIRTELGWRPSDTFENSLWRTVRWYLDNPWWWRHTKAEALESVA